MVCLKFLFILRSLSVTSLRFSVCVKSFLFSKKEEISWVDTVVFFSAFSKIGPFSLDLLHIDFIQPLRHLGECLYTIPIHLSLVTLVFFPSISTFIFSFFFGGH